MFSRDAFARRSSFRFVTKLGVSWSTTFLNLDSDHPWPDSGLVLDPAYCPVRWILSSAEPSKRKAVSSRRSGAAVTLPSRGEDGKCAPGAGPPNAETTSLSFRCRSC